MSPNNYPSCDPKAHAETVGKVRTTKPLPQTGYVSSQLIEEEQLFAQRSSRTIGSGLLIGAILVTLLGIGVLIWHLPSQSNTQPTQQNIFPRNEAPSPNSF